MFLQSVTLVNWLFCCLLMWLLLSCFQIFFEGVEARVAAGVKWEEVGFQLAFSKTELRKVIKEYPGKEVSHADG